MCHHWGCRRGEEFCAWRDAQRKKRVGRRDVYKEHLTGAQSTARSDSQTPVDLRVSERIGKKEQNEIPQSISYQAEQHPLDYFFLVLIIVFASSAQKLRVHQP